MCNCCATVAEMDSRKIMATFPPLALARGMGSCFRKQGNV